MKGLDDYGAEGGVSRFVLATAAVVILVAGAVYLAVLWGGFGGGSRSVSSLSPSGGQGSSAAARPVPEAAGAGKKNAEASPAATGGKKKAGNGAVLGGLSTDAWKRKVEAGWKNLLPVFAKEGISVDLEKKRVSVKGAIIRDKESPRYPIEYIVVSEGGSTHEALVLIKAVPSDLNAALLSIGLEPGHTVIFRKKDPPPPPEDVASGKTSPYEVIPPSGMVMHIYVHYDGWKTDKNRPLEDLILNLHTHKPLDRVGWIYVGSRFATVLLGRKRVNRYIADLERNVVALYLTGYGNTLFDVNTVEGIDDSLFDVNPDRSPPLGAKVTLIFSFDEIKE